ncbi:MAG: hypothetical protein ACLPY5_00550 [Candidatus Bathyarchaeia archaeon]
MAEQRNEFQDKMAEWLSTHWKGDKVCPICKSNSWVIPNEVGEIHELFIARQDQLGRSLKTYPVITVTCSVCGNTLLFNAFITRIITPSPESKTTFPPPVEAKSG